MRTQTAADTGGTLSQLMNDRSVRAEVGDQYRALWAMTRTERIAAMWRGQLTTRQLCQWSSRAQHEVPLLGGEFAWIGMRTPEWAEATDRAKRAA